jgi:hypothetical protein
LVDVSGAKGSGGQFAVGTWVRADDFQVETHVRGGLGIVQYQWSGASFTHQAYMRWLGTRRAYPGFSDEPLDGFRHLAADLAGPAAALLDIVASDFAAALAGISQLPRRVLP